MKKYIVHDKYGGDFMGWTHDEPLTKNQILGYLYSLANSAKSSDDDLWTWNNFRKNFKHDEFMAEWNIELEAVK